MSKPENLSQVSFHRKIYYNVFVYVTKLVATHFFVAKTICNIIIFALMRVNPTESSLDLWSNHIKSERKIVCLFASSLSCGHHHLADGASSFKVQRLSPMKLSPTAG